MGFGNYPDKYLLFNSELSKHLAIVLEIEGVPTLFGVADSYTNVTYGTPGIVYGTPGVVYGGLQKIGSIKPYMMLDGGLTIQQRIEPEQGRGNIGTLTINLIDYQGEVSKIIAPGIVVPEIMGQRCRFYIGFTETSFPTDYVLLYQGYITQCVCPPGKVQLQISDSSSKARQPVFDIATTTLLAPIPATAAASGILVAVSNTSVLHQQILGPDGTYDPTVSTYMVVDSEIFQYAATGILSATGVLCTTVPGYVGSGVGGRGCLGTSASTHDAGSTVNGSVGFGFNSEGINCIDFALKILLSGWDGPDFEGIPVLSFVFDYNGGFVQNEFLLSGQDALLDLGLATGDYFYITGSASGNDVSGRIIGFNANDNGVTNLILTDQTFTLENPTSAEVSFRSQYDTFPVTCGVGCQTADVDVATFQMIRSTYFSSGGASNIRIYYDAPVDGQDTIASEVMLPFGCYSISRYGRISMAITKPPLPGSNQKIVELNYHNIIDPDKIVVTRATNQRSFYNQVSYEFDYDVANQVFDSVQYFIDTQSLTNFGYTVVLPIQSNGLSSELGGALIAQERGKALLNRFKQCLIWIELTVNWSVGSLLEVSDIVLLTDNGTLKIMNFETGERDLGVNLYEVIDRSYQIASGNVKLKLLGGLGFDQTSRFGLISPSSILTAGSTTTEIRLTPSYGQTSIANEIAKWSPFVGLPILVHSASYAVTGMTTLQSVDGSDAAGLIVSPPLPFAPSAGMILDIVPYDTGTDPTVNQLYKRLYAFVTPSVLVASGVSQLQFSISPSGTALLTTGNDVIVRNQFYDLQSPEVELTGITGTSVTVGAALGFVPISGEFMEGIGFHDGTSFYRYG